VSITYRTLVADPPWPLHWEGGTGGRRRNRTPLAYQPMSYTDIAALGPWPTAQDASLLLWVTQDALHCGAAQCVARLWGFERRAAEVIWRKPNFGMGVYPRSGHETCVIYHHGRGSVDPDGPRDVHSVQTWAQPYTGVHGKQHSAKPDGFLDFVEAGFRAPYLELFARRARFGWAYWGDESLETAATA
jgi:N6-adenosine-specific RNA methylase IME4